MNILVLKLLPQHFEKETSFFPIAGQMLWERQETLGDVTFMFENKDMSPWGLQAEAIKIRRDDLIRLTPGVYPETCEAWAATVVRGAWVRWLDMVGRRHGFGVDYFSEDPMPRSRQIETALGLPYALRMYYNDLPLPQTLWQRL